MTKAVWLKMLRVLTAGVMCACSTMTLAADATATDDPWSGMKEWFAGQSQKLDSILQHQSEEDTSARDWEAKRAQDAQLRAMYREAVLLSELNVAWIEDQLDHWDCRIAEQAVVDVQQRQAELSEFDGKLKTLCAQVGAQDTAQQRVCRSQGEQMGQDQRALTGLAQRYQGECPAAPATPTQAPVQGAEVVR